LRPQSSSVEGTATIYNTMRHVVLCIGARRLDCARVRNVVCLLVEVFFTYAAKRCEAEGWEAGICPSPKRAHKCLMFSSSRSRLCPTRIIRGNHKSSPPTGTACKLGMISCQVTRCACKKDQTATRTTLHTLTLYKGKCTQLSHGLPHTSCVAKYSTPYTSTPAHEVG